MSIESNQIKSTTEFEDPFDPFSPERKKWNKAMGRFYPKAKIKRFDLHNWYAYIPGESPKEVTLFLKKMFQGEE